MKSSFLFYIAVLLSAEMYIGKVAYADATTLQDYLNQVHGKNQEQVGSQKGIEAAKLKTFESELMFTPKLFAEARVGSDGKPFSPPLLTYDRIDTQSYSAGLSEQFTFGLQTKLYYSLTHTSYINSPQLIGQPTDYYDANPTLELSMPLWGNGFGRTSRAQKSLTIKSNEAEEFGFRARSVGNDVIAENIYWSLAVSREVFRVQKNALIQAQAILNYVKKQSMRRLGEDADVLQAQALVATRQLELNRAEAKVNTAQSEFNALRGVASGQVSDTLEILPYKSILEFHLPETRPGERYDVRSSRTQVEVASAASTIAIEQNSPTLDLYGGYTLNGRADSINTTNSNLQGSYQPTRYVGLKLNVPLDFSALDKARSGARLAVDAQRGILQQTIIAQEKDWNTSLQKFKDTRDALVLSNDLVQAQGSKLDREKARLKQGKTTTYQVLLFEQDKSQAEIMRAELTQQILGIRAGLKLYPTDSLTMEASSK